MPRTDCTILVADDDRFLREAIAEMLSSEGYRVLQSGTAEETWKTAIANRPNLILLDIKFPDSNDLNLLARIKAEIALAEVIVISNQKEDIGRIVEAIKLGAYDFLDKPFGDAELQNRVSKALEMQSLRSSQQHLLKELETGSGIDALLGDGGAIKQVKAALRKLAAASGSILISGESGTGKELAARALHYLSSRRNKPFSAINCASIPEALTESLFFGHRKGAFTGAVDSSKGKFETVEDGTLFLDEIGDLPLSQQGTLLRVLEYRKFCRVGETEERDCKARFVFATNRDLSECVRAGTFREDLFYRINVGAVAMPPLRARTEDIPSLAKAFCVRLSSEMGRRGIAVSQEVLEVFKAYDWPGNVRELRNVIESSIMLLETGSTQIQLSDLPPELVAIHVSSGDSPKTLSVRGQRERKELMEVLRQCKGNQAKAAKILGIHRNTIRTKIRLYGLSTTDEA